MQVNPNGLPPADLIENGPIRDAVAAWQEARTAANEAIHTANQLEHERPVAEQEDAAALAQALREGKKDPGPKAVRAVDERIAEAHRHVEARKLLVDQAYHDLLLVAEEHEDAWAHTVEARVKQAREKLTEALDALGSAHGDLQTALALRNVIASGKWSPGAFANIIGLPSLNREVGVGEALSAFRQFTQEPGREPDLHLVESVSTLGVTDARWATGA